MSSQPEKLPRENPKPPPAQGAGEEVSRILVAPPAPERRAPPMLLVAMGLVLACGVALAGWLVMTRGTERTDDARVVVDIIPLSARVAGQVVRVLVEEDQSVKQGDVLFELDDRLAALKVAEAETSLVMFRAQQRAAIAEAKVIQAGAQGGLRSARAGVVGAEEEIHRLDARSSEVEADVLVADKSLQQSARELERIQKLFAGNVVSQSQLDDAQVTWEKAGALLERARAQSLAVRSEKRLAESRSLEAHGRLDQNAASEARITMAETNVELATARVLAAEQALETARLNLSFTKVIAPRDGTVSKRTSHEGHFVQMGQPMVQLVTNTPVVVANFKETQLTDIRAGQPATLHVDAYPDRALKGTVVSISRGTSGSFSLLPPNNASGNFIKVVQRVPVRIALSESSPVPLQAGLSVEVTVHTR